MHLPPIPRFLARFCMRLIIVVVFIGLPGAVLYLRQVGVEFGLKERVAEALSGPSFHTTIGKLLFDPFRGLIAQQIEITETSGEKRKLASIEQVVISLSLSDLLAHKVSIDLIELHDTNVSIPMGSQPDAPRLSLRQVEAELIFLADQVRISHFEANVQGIKVSLSGLLKNPSDFHLSPQVPASQGQQQTDKLANLTDQIADLKYSAQAPEVSAEISGDLADLSTLKFSPIKFHSGPVAGDGWKIDSIEGSAEYSGGRLIIDRLRVREGKGALLVSGKWVDGALAFEMTSSLTPEPLRIFLPKESPLTKIQFTEAPQIDVRGTVGFSSSPVRVDVTGAIRCGKFSFRKVGFDSFSADFVYRDGRFFARGARLVAGSGELLADIMHGPDDFRLRIDNSVPPTLFSPLFGEKEKEFLDLMEFKDNPSIQLEVRGPKPDFADMKGGGFLKLGRTAMRGSWIDFAQTKFEIEDRAVTYRDFTLGRGKGEGSGTFVYDFGRQEVRLTNISSTMNPVEVMMWVDPKIADGIRPYRFRQPPKAHGGGLVHMKDPKKTNLSLTVDAADGLEYDLLNRTLRFGRTQGELDIIGTKVHADIKSAKLMGGDIGVDAIVSTDPRDPTFSMDVDVRRVNFAPLTKLYFNYDDSLGFVSGKYKFSARVGQEEKMRGEGSIRVQDGNVFAIPILGPLSDIISKIIPGSGYQNARMATADFQIADEKISTKNLEIEGKGFSLFGRGDIFFMRDKMDLSVRINARGIPGVVFFPVSKLFEYVSTGSPSKPEWRPKIIPRFKNDGD